MSQGAGGNRWTVSARNRPVAHAPSFFNILRNHPLMLSHARQFIRENRRSPPFRWIGIAAEKYLRAYYNEEFFEFRKNGETFAAETLKAWMGGTRAIVWDVGANCGQWAMEVATVLPDAEIHSFEIVPSIRDKLIAKTAHSPNITVHSVGLSDSCGNITVHFNPSHEDTSSVSPRLGGRWFHDGTVEVPAHVVTADEMTRTIPTPHFMKIDVHIRAFNEFETQ